MLRDTCNCSSKLKHYFKHVKVVENIHFIFYIQKKLIHDSVQIKKTYLQVQGILHDKWRQVK
jgi:hypothetical protein